MFQPSPVAPRVVVSAIRNPPSRSPAYPCIPHRKLFKHPVGVNRAVPYRAEAACLVPYRWPPAVAGSRKEHNGKPERTYRFVGSARAAPRLGEQPEQVGQQDEDAEDHHRRRMVSRSLLGTLAE